MDENRADLGAQVKGVGAEPVARHRYRQLVAAGREPVLKTHPHGRHFARAKRPVGPWLNMRAGGERDATQIVEQRQREQGIDDIGVESNVHPDGAFGALRGRDERIAVGGLERARSRSPRPARAAASRDRHARRASSRIRLKLSSLYWRVIDAGSPMSITRPRSISIARSQKRSTEPMSWVTNRIVRPAAFRRVNSSKHFCWNDASPTASTSSISTMSASTWIATENARRTIMPDE